MILYFLNRPIKTYRSSNKVIPTRCIKINIITIDAIIIVLGRANALVIDIESCIRLNIDNY